MTSRERILKAIHHEIPDRVPIFSFSVDPKFIKELGHGDPIATFEILGVDAFPLRAQAWCQGTPLLASLKEEIPEYMTTAGGIFAGWHGIDEFGRIWKRGSYIGGDLKTEKDLGKYIPPLLLSERSNPERTRELVESHPDKAFCLNFHCGPFGLTVESMGFDYFFLNYYDQRDLIEKVLDARTDWFIAIAQYVVELGADFVVMGDDVAYKNRTYISPKDFEELVFPRYRKIVQSLNVPLIWHSDGYITPLLQGAIDAGITGVQALEPTAGVDLGEVKREYGDRLVLMGNVDCVYALCQKEKEPVREEVRRCMDQAKQGGGYIISESNSLHSGCETEAILEMVRYAEEIGVY